MNKFHFSFPFSRACTLGLIGFFVLPFSVLLKKKTVEQQMHAVELEFWGKKRQQGCKTRCLSTVNKQRKNETSSSS